LGMELLTVQELVALLKVSKRHVYELMQDRTRSGDLREHPLPYLKLGHSVRFRKSDIEAWIEKLVAKSANP
jgi:predicted DNA-binding transcriptional regulator AlpA